MEIGHDAEDDLGLSSIMGLGVATDGRIGRTPASGVEYAYRASPGFEIRKNVLDASEGANYAGGSSYAPGLPLGPSTWGLAGMEGVGSPPDRARLEAALTNFDYGMAGIDNVIDTDPMELELLPSQVGVKPWPPLEEDRSDLFLPTVTTVKNGLSGFEGLDAVTPGADMSKADRSMRAVMKASMFPGTPMAGSVVKTLAAKGVSLGRLAHNRAQATFKARREVRKLDREVDKLENKVKMAAARIFVGTTEGAMLSPSATPAEIRRFETLRQRQLLIAKRSVRMQKVNAIGTAMAQNAAAQATLTQQIAATVLTGQPNTTAALALAYNKIGQKSRQMRGIRQRQIVNSVSQQKKDTLQALLTRKASLIRQMGRVEIQLSRCTPSGRPVLLGRRRAFQVQIAQVDGQLRSLCSRNQTLGVAGYDALEADLDAELAELEFFKKLWKKAKKTVKRVVKKAKRGVRRIRRVAKRISPAHIAYRAIKKTKWGRRIVRAVRVPIKSVRRMMKRAHRFVLKAAGKLFVDWPCRLMTSTVGRVATKIAGTAVGTVYGGPVGGGVGAAVADRANDLNKNICGGLKRLGLTEGKFRTSRLGSVLKRSASTFFKNAVSPKKFMRSAMTIGMGAMGGGAGAGVLGKLGAGQIQRLGMQQLQKQAINYGKKRLIGYAAKQGGRYVGRAIGGRTGQIVGSLAAQGARMAASGKYDAKAFSNLARRQLFAQNLQKLARTHGQRIAMQQLRRRVPASRMFINKSGRVGYPSAARAQRYMRGMTGGRMANLGNRYLRNIGRQRLISAQRRAFSRNAGRNAARLINMRRSAQANVQRRQQFAAMQRLAAQRRAGAQRFQQIQRQVRRFV